MYPKKKPTLSVKEAAIQLLSRRDHGIVELQQKLAQKGYEDDEVQQAIAFCHEYHYLDDLRFAKSQVRQHVFKGHGKRRIQQELNAKRVAESVIEAALEEEAPDWFELAKETALKKFKGKPAADKKEHAKQVRFLQYRGYSFDQIHYALSDDEG
ncbi:MAG: recombination regulator RecX [Vibrio sp.]